MLDEAATNSASVIGRVNEKRVHVAVGQSHECDRSVAIIDSQPEQSLGQKLLHLFINRGAVHGREKVVRGVNSVAPYLDDTLRIFRAGPSNLQHRTIIVIALVADGQCPPWVAARSSDQGELLPFGDYADRMSLADENAEILRGIAARGTDLSLPRLVDFAHVFFSEAGASQFGDAAAQAGHQISIQEDESGAIWDVVASLKTVPSVGQITRIEEELDGLDRLFGGQSDGWGFLED